MSRQITDGPIEIVRFSPEFLPAIKRFSEEIWLRPRSDAYYQWRYLQCPSQTGFLAMQEGECLAMIWGFARPYKVGGTRQNALEILDWYCRQDLRASGLGIKVMQMLMDIPEPLINVGGSADTLRLLPRLKWSSRTPMKRYLIPITGKALSVYIQKKLYIPSICLQIPLSIAAKAIRLASPQPKIPNGQSVQVARVGPEILSLYDRPHHPGIVPLPNLDFIRWLMNSPDAMGQYIAIYFFAGDRLCGWSFMRLYTTPAGKEARIIEAASNNDSPASYRWLISETLQVARAHNSDIVFAGASDLTVQKALAQNRFLFYSSIPVQVLSKDGFPDQIPVHVQNNTSDFALLPYPTTTLGERVQ